MRQTASQTAKPWRTAQTATYDTVGGLAVWYFIPTYRAKNYSANPLAVCLAVCLNLWRSDPLIVGRPPDRHGTRGVAV